MYIKSHIYRKNLYIKKYIKEKYLNKNNIYI